MHGQIRVMHIRPDCRKQVGQLAADTLADLGRGERELFVPALGFHLKSPCLRKARRQIGLRDLDPAFERLFRTHGCARDSREAEYMPRAVHDRVRVGLLRHLDVHDRLPHGNFAVRHMLHTPRQVFEQAILKGFAVETLEHDLTALEQQYFFHNVSFISAGGMRLHGVVHFFLRAIRRPPAGCSLPF